MYRRGKQVGFPGNGIIDSESILQIPFKPRNCTVYRSRKKRCYREQMVDPPRPLFAGLLASSLLFALNDMKHIDTRIVSWSVLGTERLLSRNESF